jgi:glutamate dehydrogenase/leucine dehydrogenase
VVLGGTAGRREATGLGAVFCTERLLEHLGWDLAGQRVAIQGFGNVGATMARELDARGAVIVGLSDVTGGVVDQAGLDVAAVERWVTGHRFMRGCTEGIFVTRQEILETPCDILIPAALEHQITEDNAADLDCRLIVEAANGPTTPEAEEILSGRGVMILPDLLVNSGGVTVSYFEWVQDQQKFFWDGLEVASRLESKMRTAVDSVIENAESLATDWRTAAQSVAIERIAEASRLRAIYP